MSKQDMSLFFGGEGEDVLWGFEEAVEFKMCGEP